MLAVWQVPETDVLAFYLLLSLVLADVVLHLHAHFCDTSLNAVLRYFL